MAPTYGRSRRIMQISLAIKDYDELGYLIRIQNTIMIHDLFFLKGESATVAL